MEEVAESVRPVVLFDGLCHLCNSFVRFVLERDPAGQFAFAPLQSEFAQRRLSALHLKSIVLVVGDEVFYAEDAVLRILSCLRSPWRWLAEIVGWIPRWMLAWGYRFVVRHRYRLFGRRETCMLPQPGWRGRFLS